MISISGKEWKEYKTPKRIPRPDNETDEPTINRINRDFLFGVD